MKPLDRLSEYLGALERRMRWLALTRGAAVTAGAALALTVVAVLVAKPLRLLQPERGRGAGVPVPRAGVCARRPR